jgi:hypothetical protein
MNKFIRRLKVYNWKMQWGQIVSGLLNEGHPKKLIMPWKEYLWSKRKEL